MEKNLTPGHLAAKMGIAMALVRSWESGGSQPDRKQLQGLANYLGLLCERHQEAQLIGRRP
jgi:ribosome-binding protein aMBF1 (putative translation factor)